MALIRLPPLLRQDRKKYDMREYPDWRLQADAIEAELTRRNETFKRIAW